MRSLWIFPLVVMLACAPLGTELTRTRPEADGWSLSLHGGEPGKWTLALWHPEAFQARSDDPVRAFLLGEKTTASVSSSRTQRMDGPVHVTTTTRWTVDEARWRTGEPFQIRIKHGVVDMEPLSQYREITLAVRLGPTPGSSDGLQVKVMEL